MSPQPSTPGARYAQFAPLIVGAAGFPKCPNNGPNLESSLEAPGAKRLILQIQKFNIWLQLGWSPQGKGAGLGSIVWLTPQPFVPMLASLVRDFDAVRVWNFTSGSEAEVFINPA